MKEYSYNIKIKASSENEAKDKISAFATLASHLTAAELAKMAHVLKTDASKTAIAKQFLGV
ncbi:MULTISPECIES: hypothetical protein [unclassified Chitinophaga]|jgi:hypothetical protein|uniref:hypothetical protein n=1 Tax=unclassified Chitinophaga TaxID=2619133 RepID=UPI0011ACA7B4|nr:hypothetical protein [Chitinophaga sp. LS1]WPV65451.1 hypothetical protein QQL36_26990 [Chitinophaga sp. LS1]WPV70588.1 hypothetical protein QQL36_17910 [Chitinophaga sp. LS1]